MGLTMIIVSLILLMVFAYRGYSILFIAPVFAVLAAVGSGHELMPVFSEIYMTKAAEYVKTYYPVFLLGAVFAKIMEEGGLGEEWLAWAQQTGVSPEVLHRIVSMASECVDTGPHSGALVTLMAVCGLTHRESYYDVVMLTLLKTLVVFLCLAVYMLTGII